MEKDLTQFKMTLQPIRGQSGSFYLVSSTPSLTLHLQAELKSGAGTQQSSRPDSCTSSSWATCWPCWVSKVKTLSEIWNKHTSELNESYLQTLQRISWIAATLLVLTWSLIPVAMWPTFTRRVSLMRMLRLLKSLTQTSTPEPTTEQRDARVVRAKAFHVLKVWTALGEKFLSYLTFKTARRRWLWLTQQIHAENLHIWLTAVGEDTGAEVISWAQGPAARVLE